MIKCFHCQEPALFTVCSWRIEDRPLCGSCAIPYSMSFLWTFTRLGEAKKKKVKK